MLLWTSKTFSGALVGSKAAYDHFHFHPFTALNTVLNTVSITDTIVCCERLSYMQLCPNTFCCNQQCLLRSPERDLSSLLWNNSQVSPTNSQEPWLDPKNLWRPPPIGVSICSQVPQPTCYCLGTWLDISSYIYIQLTQLILRIPGWIQRIFGDQL